MENKTEHISKDVKQSNIVLMYILFKSAQCSVTCGDGTQTRELTCIADNVEVSLSLCEGVGGVETTQDCNEQQCPSFVTGEWDEVCEIKSVIVTVSGC